MKQRMSRVERERLLSEVLSAVGMEWSARFEQRYRPPVSRVILRRVEALGRGLVMLVATVLGGAAVVLLVILVAPLGHFWGFAIMYGIALLLRFVGGRDGSRRSSS